MVLLNPGIRALGVSAGAHPLSKTVIVLEFAHDYVSETATPHWEAVARGYFERAAKGTVELLSLLRRDPTWLERVVLASAERFIFGRELVVPPMQMRQDYAEMLDDLRKHATRTNNDWRLEWSAGLSEGALLQMEDEE